ncbi:MAG: ComEA family DNA-binding protein [Pyrinomonadaceae bacterium]
MFSANSHYFCIYRFTLNILLLAVLCFLTANCKQNEEKQFLSTENQFFPPENAININTASREELETIPNIGEKTAESIINYREEFGNFRRIENIMLVEGISDKKFRNMRHLIKAE